MDKIKRALLIATVTSGAAALVFALLSSDRNVGQREKNNGEIDADHFSSEEQETLARELDQML